MMQAYTEEQRAELIERCKMISSWREKYGDYANVMLPAVEAKELAEIALAALTAKPDHYIFNHPNGKLFNALVSESCKEDENVIAGYTAPPAAAPVAPDFSECPLCDSNYISGMQAGYKFGAEQDRAGFNAAVEHYRKEMRGRRALRLNVNQSDS